MAAPLVASIGATPGVNGGATGAINTTGATLIVLSVFAYGPGAVPTVADNKGNTYLGLTERLLSQARHRLYYCLAPVGVGAGHTFTVTGTGAYPAVWVFAFSGSWAFQVETGASTSGAFTLPCGSLTPSADGALVVTGTGAAPATSTDTLTPAGFALVSQPYGGSTNIQGSAAWLVQAVAAPINPTWGFAPTQTYACVAAAVFVPATGGGGGMGAYSTAVIADGASHYWRLGEPSGTTAADSIAGGANAPGTISGGVTLGQPGPLADGSKAMLFNGTTGKIATAAAVVLPVVLTIEAWIKTPGSAANQTISGNYPQAAGGAVAWTITTANLLSAYLPVPNVSIDGVTPVANNAWHHVAFVLTGSVATQYVDGVVDNGGQPCARGVSSTDLFYIGANTNTALLFAGALAEVAIYPTALTPAQIAAHYALRTATGGGGGGAPFPVPLALVLEALA